jgi:hypothetical protein
VQSMTGYGYTIHMPEIGFNKHNTWLTLPLYLDNNYFKLNLFEFNKNYKIFVVKVKLK